MRIPRTTGTAFIGRPATWKRGSKRTALLPAPGKVRTVEDSSVDVLVRSDNGVTVDEDVDRVPWTPSTDNSPSRPVPKKNTGVPDRKLGPRDLLSSFEQPFLGSVPLARASQRRQLEQSWSQYKGRRANRATLRDCSTSLVPNTKGEKPKEQHSGDCSTSSGANTNREHQQSGSLETARLGLVTQPNGKTIVDMLSAKSGTP